MVPLVNRSLSDLNTESQPMIDHPDLTADLLAKLRAALPVPATITPQLAATLRKQSPQAVIPSACRVVWVSHAGDEGGIVCRFSTADGGQDDAIFIASITHLAFDSRHPLARDIALYQKRRTKKLRRLHS